MCRKPQPAQLSRARGVAGGFDAPSRTVDLIWPTRGSGGRFEENADWRDDAGNACPSPADSADGGHDIDFAWCLAYGYEEFEQEDGSFLSGKEVRALLSTEPLPLTLQVLAFSFGVDLTPATSHSLL